MRYTGIHVLLRNDGTNRETPAESTSLRNQLGKKNHGREDNIKRRMRVKVGMKESRNW